MSNRTVSLAGLAAVVVAAGISLGVAAPARAQAGVGAAALAAPKPPPTDARWLGWLGCWRSNGDTSAGDRTSIPDKATCVVPVAGSSAVEAITVIRGKVVSRDRLDANGPPHAVSGQGCEGSESVNWSRSARRVYLRSDYMCGGTKGTSLVVNAISPSGAWLNVEEVRAGAGAVVTVDRRTPIATLSVVPQAAAAQIADRQMAITTARAAASAAVTSDEIVDAIQWLDAGVLKAWVTAADQRFELNGSELTALARADVPQSVLQAMLGSGPRTRSYVVATDSTHDVDAYLNRRVYDPGFANAAVPGGGTYPTAAPAMTTMVVCPAFGCPVANPYSMYNGYNSYVGYPVPYPVYAPGVLTYHNGGGRVPFRPAQPVRPHAPMLPGPVGRRP